MSRRTLAYATLVLAAFLVGRWSVGNQWITQTLQPVAAGLVDTREEGRDLLTDLELRTVTRVIDGDTLVLNGGERVRLIGVDTPESVHATKPVEYFGKEASAFTKRMAEDQQVYLEYEQGSPTKDRYERTLAYVYLRDGTLLNKEIIEQGYGHAYTRLPFSKMEEFREAQREARAAGRGLWNGGGGDDPESSTGLPQDDRQRARQSPSLAQGQCIPASECCKVCSQGQACGDSCIRASSTCRKGRGCACDKTEVC